MNKHTITSSALDTSITYSVKDSSVRGCHTTSGCNIVVGDMVLIDNYFHEVIEDPTEGPTEATEGAKATEASNSTTDEKRPEKREFKPACVSISPGNTKMGAIPSVSLPPVITCPAGCPCSKKCYAAKLCRIYPSVKKAYQNNLDILRENPAKYWNGVYEAAKMTRFFRYHVSGDIPTAEYFARMVHTAQALPGTNFLAFTKKYDIVNGYLNHGGTIPQNLHIIFSEWPGIAVPNPYNLPTSAVIFKGTDPDPNWKICGGNCATCACQGVGCWELKNGETIAFYEH